MIPALPRRSEKAPLKVKEAAPALDAALVRILKRFHVLSGEELLRKLADYPQSLELPSCFAAPDARNAAAHGGEVAFDRLRALCDRGLLRGAGLKSMLFTSIYSQESRRKPHFRPDEIAFCGPKCR